MRITIEEYNINIHGPFDDCDYVISYTDKSRSFAMHIAEKLSHHIHKYDFDNQIYLCHA